MCFHISIDDYATLLPATLSFQDTDACSSHCLSFNPNCMRLVSNSIKHGSPTGFNKENKKMNEAIRIFVLDSFPL